MILNHGIVLLIVANVLWRRNFYSKLGANYLTITAGETLSLIVNYWQEISFWIQLFTHFKDISWAKLNTKATTLASFLIYIYLARSCRCLSIIEGFSPQLHSYTIHKQCSRLTSFIASKVSLTPIRWLARLSVQGV